MTALRPSGLRPWLAVVLAFVLSIAGVGRGWAGPSEPFEAVPVIAGVAVPICHADHDGSTGQDLPGQHDCCDTCALCAAVTASTGPDLTAPIAVVHVVEHAAALAWRPILFRPHSPRQAQGPPAVA